MTPPVSFITKPTDKARAIESKLRLALRGKRLKAKKPVVIAIGGDGTMLQAVKEHLHDDVEFAGVSAGWLGFLQTVEPDEVDQLVEALASGDYHTTQAPLLRYALGPTGFEGYAFNDISIERASARAAKFSLYVDKSAGKFVGDGVIFSTPLGSTAYAMAAGGPIIDAGARDVLLVTPNNPHMSVLYSSLQRPHVLSQDRVVRLSFDADELRERPLQLIADGQTIPMDFAEDLEISLSKKSVSLIELERDGWQNHIDEKRLGRN